MSTRLSCCVSDDLRWIFFTNKPLLPLPPPPPRHQEVEVSVFPPLPLPTTPRFINNSSSAGYVLYFVAHFIFPPLTASSPCLPILIKVTNVLITWKRAKRGVHTAVDTMRRFNYPPCKWRKPLRVRAIICCGYSRSCAPQWLIIIIIRRHMAVKVWIHYNYVLRVCVPQDDYVRSWDETQGSDESEFSLLVFCIPTLLMCHVCVCVYSIWTISIFTWSQSVTI